MSRINLQKILEIGQMCNEYAKVDRLTMFSDGKTYESDTDHTVMIGIIGCAIASKFYPNLNVGKIAEYALAHDLVEVYAGDTNSINISSEAKKEKDEREKLALEKIKNKFGADFDWVHTQIENYESQKDLESRFVKLLDKILPKVTNSLNNLAAYKNLKDSADKEKLKYHLESQYGELYKKYNQDFPEMLILLKELNDDLINRM